MIRVAAVGDIHFGTDSAGRLHDHIRHINARADLFLLAGDLTRWGEPDEAVVLAEDLRDCTLPMVGVLGNHDFQCDRNKEIADIMEAAGVTMLEGSNTTVEVDGQSVGIAGSKGFGGGFQGASGSDFGEPEMKAFIQHTKSVAESLHESLSALDTDFRIALLHYAPVEHTLTGERLEIYPFLGSYLLAEAIDDAGADLILHGHAHGGAEKGVTPGGIHVRNVAQPVIRHAYNIYCVTAEGELDCD